MYVLPALSRIALIVATALATHAHAQASEASVLSALPIGVTWASPVVILGSGGSLTVDSVFASLQGSGLGVAPVTVREGPR